MDYADHGGEDEISVSYSLVQARDISLWHILAIVIRAIGLMVSVIAETLMQFAYTFFGKAEHDELRKKFAAEASRSIETITGGE